MIKGITLHLAGTDYDVPPIALGDLERLQDRIAGFQGGLDKDSVATVIDAAHAALKRNYPEITRETVAGLVDVANMGEVFSAVMDVSGLLRKERDAGEA
ncbi:MAG TPA: hypothetical protein PLN96_05125 [Zoogloea sp.]|uniref:hypothetical protein n=1 Tax=Zoogloea sp. TaxID=49181 RepID=UPI002C1EA07F|nr:hypothetical protein [Zoogloea sp.]HNA67279.1 hypothetical protein [Rhodocyclaceae bacterium]HNI47219.1 hypothetical protein [Zoogloea sp.]